MKFRTILTNSATTDADRAAATDKVLRDMTKAGARGQRDAADQSAATLGSRARQAAGYDR